MLESMKYVIKKVATGEKVMSFLDDEKSKYGLVVEVHNQCFPSDLWEIVAPIVHTQCGRHS